MNDKAEKSSFFQFLPIWTIAAPIVAVIAYSATALELGELYKIFLTIALFSSVLSAVHHAEVIAHRVGEPFGTLVLALAVTLIECSLIVTLMFAGGASASVLARDTVFAAVMIILTGIVGICLLLGGIKHREQSFRLEGASAALATLSAITVLTLLLPNYTSTVPGPVYSTSQLVFIALISLVLYISFVLVQTMRHRGYFLAIDDDDSPDTDYTPDLKATFSSLGLLLVSLVGVVLIAKYLSPTIEEAVIKAGAPQEVVGIIIAGLVLLPEGLAAVMAARKNQLQTSLNLALGSALATIGLTIPAVSAVSVLTGLPLVLGLEMKSTVMLLLALFVSTITLRTGRTTILQGIVLLVIFSVYIFTTVIP